MTIIVTTQGGNNHARWSSSLSFAGFQAHGMLVHPGLPNRARVEDHVFDALALPGIGDVNETVGGLDHRRVRILTWSLFEHGGGFPFLTIFRDSHVQRSPSNRRVVVDQQVPTVL